MGACTCETNYENDRWSKKRVVITKNNNSIIYIECYLFSRSSGCFSMMLTSSPSMYSWSLALCCSVSLRAFMTYKKTDGEMYMYIHT